MALDLERLIRYRIDSTPPQQHGQGQVWKATDLLFDRLVALKFIRTDLAHDSQARHQLRKEAMAGARLGSSHPNIVQVFDLGTTEEHLYFAMEWLDGGTLQPFCGAISFRRAITIMTQLAGAVAVAHENGIVHSDIAPINVLIGRPDVYKLADFGYLKILDSVMLSKGSDPLIIGGRPYFMPPAHRLNPATIDFSTDTYALALTFHLLVTGEMLSLDPDGFPSIRGPIVVRHEQRESPDGLRKMLNRFTRGRLQSDTAHLFIEYLRRL